MKNFNHSGNNNDNTNANNSTGMNNGQVNNQTRQSNPQPNQSNGDGFFTKVVNWGVSLAVKYGKTFEIIIWALTIIGILFMPILALAMTYFAYCYSRVNPTRGHIMMAVAVIGGIVSWIIIGKSNDDSSDNEVWYYFWTE